MKELKGSGLQFEAQKILFEYDLIQTKAMFTFNYRAVVYLYLLQFECKPRPLCLHWHTNRLVQDDCCSEYIVRSGDDGVFKNVVR